MQNSFRWYGPDDPVSLSDIRQSNAEYIVTSLHQIPYGEKWSKDDVRKRIDFINKYNNSNNINDYCNNPCIHFLLQRKRSKRFENNIRNIK